jgi:tetraacyldisaccharide 4'-kinase
LNFHENTADYKYSIILFGMKKLRLILWPFALLYGSVVALRNLLYNWGCFSQYRVPSPSIGVGNLAVGGTGKSVVVSYLAKHFTPHYKVGMISRGYGRKTKGVIIAKGQETATTLGDEPLQLFSQFPDVKIAVAESRKEGTVQLLQQHPELQVLLYDDCLQHRSILPSQMLLTTTYQNPYTKDFLLPVGQLREFRSGAKRAELLVVTKCPPTLTSKEKEAFIHALQPMKNQSVVFTNVHYHKQIIGVQGNLEVAQLRKESIVLVTGIANPQPLCDQLQKQGVEFEHRAFADHHNFTPSEVQQLQILSKGRRVLTTEKDYMRLAPLWKHQAPLYYWPIALGFVDAEDETQLKEWLKKCFKKD